MITEAVDGAGADGCDDAQDGFPQWARMRARVHAAGIIGSSVRIVGWLAEAVEPAVLEVGDARRELEAQQGA